MPLNQTQRPKFYEEQYLGAADLTAAVDYGRLQSARHALGAHTWGIAAGLQLQEKDVSAGGGQVEMFIQPGYAWDGFGRPIVVLAPYKIPAELFKAIPFEANSPAGQLMKVWLRYDESATQRARPGFEACNRADQFSRVQETFRVEIGERPNHDDRHNPVSVAGYLVDAQETLHKLDPTDPQLYDESVPYQNFPDTGAPARWLIPLGAVRWQPNPDPNQPGAFAKRIEDDLKFSRNLRRYIGVVAEAVEAADGRIRMKSRAKDYSTVVSDDLVWVEGDLRVEGDVRLFNHKLDFRDSSGLDNNGIPLSIQRADLSGPSGSLQVVIGRSDKGDNTFVVGPLDGSNTFAAKLTVRDDGNVGIGTSNPTQMLTFSTPEGNRLEIGRTSTTLPWSPTTPARPGAFVINQQSQGSSESGADFALMRDRKKRLTLLDTDTNLSSQGGGSLRFFVNYDELSGSQEALTITGAGNVGIGTTNPTHKFHVLADEAVGLFESTTATQAYLRLATSEGLNNRVEITNRQGGRLSLFTSGAGDAFNITRDGNVGIGTETPSENLHVQGNLRVETNLYVVGQAWKRNGSSWTALSDERLKENINPLKDALSRLLQLHGASFFWRSSESTPKVTDPQMGLIAQQVEKVFPEWVTTAPDGYKALTLNGFEALTIEALRELKAEIESLKARPWRWAHKLRRLRNERADGRSLAHPQG